MKAVSGRSCCLCRARAPVTLHSFPKGDLKSLWKNICNYQSYDDVSRLVICSNHFTPSDYIEPNAKQFGGKLRLKPNRFPSTNVPNKIEFVQVPAPSTFLGETGNIECTLEDPLSIAPHEEITPVKSTTMYYPLPAPSPMISAKTENFDVSSIAPREEITQVKCTTESHPLPAPSSMISAKPENMVIQTPQKKRFAEPRFFGEITPADMDCPSKARRMLNLVQEKVRRVDSKNNSLQQKNRRLLTKIKSVRDLVKQMKTNNSLSEEAADALLGTLGHSGK